MPADQSPSQQPPFTATTTITAVTTFASAAPPEPPPSTPRWGDPLESIPSDRHMRLLQLAARQRAWVASAPDGQRDLAKSVFRGERLNGAEVFFLAAEALANERAITLQEAAALLRVPNADDPNAWVHLASLHLEGANLRMIGLAGAILSDAHLEGANLSYANLAGAFLFRTHLSGADISRANLAGAYLHSTNLAGARLWFVTFDATTNLAYATLGEPRSVLARRKPAYGNVKLGDIHWHNPPDLTRVRWDSLQRLGDEEGVTWRTPAFSEALPDLDHRDVVRAYRQVATQLRAQGLSEEADRFAERAQIWRRKQTFREMLEDWRRPWRLPGDLLRWLFSWFLAVLAGYGYHPGRSLFWYLATIVGFAFAYYQVTRGFMPFGLPSRSSISALPWYEAGILSISSFHGRGFFQPVQSLGDPVAAFASVEAIIGLLIEISFIATFTQRFFGTK